MREAFEAVAEFLARHGGLDEYDAVLKSMEHLGWTLDQDHAARWRALFAVLRSELSDPTQATNYVFVFERLLQLYVRMPVTMCRDIFSSPLVLHIIVERFAAAYADFDAEVFREEKEVLCHAENIYSTCCLVLDKLYNGSETTVLGVFLREFRDLFDSEDPKSAWEMLRARHRLPEVVFRRDAKRMLWSIEEEEFGKTQIEEVLGADAKSSHQRVLIPRRRLEAKFSGPHDDWSNLSDVVSVQNLSAEPPVEDRRESLLGGRLQQRMSDVAGEGPEHEDRVWSARLPIATPGGDSDASEGEDAAMDLAVRQERPTQKSPGKARLSLSAGDLARSPQRPPRQQARSPVRERQQSPARRRAEQRERQQAVQRAHDDAVEGIDDDELFNPEREIVPPKRRRKGRNFWTDAEVDALIKGVKRYGGKWRKIKDMYAEALRNRSNVDLKDKYRNLVKSKQIRPIHLDD